ncbi:MAG: hypothetical protein JWQ84_221 [Mucilaginibacter sp.]|nr:hypothetical protein [Mucilaginibacter sp.]
MENLSNIAFVSTHFPYPDLNKVSDLIYYEGPILSHFVDKKGKNLLYLWVDNDSSRNRWLIFEIDKSSLINYLHKGISLRDLVLKNRSDFLLLADINESLGIEFSNLIKKENLPEIYLPKEGSYFEFSIPQIYANSLEDEYLHSLLSDSINLKIENKTQKYLSAVKVDNLLTVLRNVKLSFTSFISINFRKDFTSEDFLSLNFETLISTVVKDSELLIPNLEYGSFCASFTTDYLMSKEISPKIQQWRKDTFLRFKSEVIEADLDINALQPLLNKYDDFDRKAIYSPILEISKDSNDYKISITDKTFKKIKRTLKPISKPIQDKLIPKIKSIDIEKKESLFQIIGIGEKVNEQPKISKKNILESKELDYAELTQSTNTIFYHENELYLKEQFDFKIVYDRGNYVIDYTPFEIHLENVSFESVKNELYKSIIDLYKRLTKVNEKELSLKEIKLKNELLDIVSIPNIKY